MNILLTGGLGFIGFFVAKAILEKGYNLILVDNLSNYAGKFNIIFKNQRLKELNELYNKISLNKNIYFKFLKIDLTKDLNVLEKEIKRISKIDVTMHLAAYPGVKYSLKYPIKYIKNNIIATQKLLDFINNNNLIEKNIIFSSTSSVYDGNLLPFKEDNCITNFLSPYSYTKFCCENILKTYNKIYKFNAIVLRYFTVFGPYNRPDMATFKFFYNLIKSKPIYINGKDISRDWTYVENTALATVNSIDLLKSNSNIFEIVNIGSDNPIKVIDYVNMIFKVANKETKVIIRDYNPYEMKSTWADITKAKKLLNYKPDNNLEKYLKITFENLKNYIK
ncbi:MAG: GDP-mannose 4,6-dehydratase [bacterium]